MADNKKKRTSRKGRHDASVDDEEASQVQPKTKDTKDEKKKKAKKTTVRMTRNKKTEEEATQQAAPAPAATSAAQASVTSMAGKFVKWASELKVEGLTKMFNDELLLALPPTKPAPSFEANPDKNRYQDVVCLEETRVKLAKENPTDTDYIHANWIKFKEYDRTYIATQGPLESTIEDFWRMVWQEQSPIVVNLTKCCEDGKAKCAQYWPEAKEGAYKQFGRFNISVKKVEEDKRVFTYVLEVLPEGCSNSLIVRMLHTSEWPDGHVMHSSTAVLRLIKCIFKVDTLAKGPVVIHCSAGIGRTGTLVLIDYILYTIFTGKHVPLKDAFLQLRSQRASSIQKEAQFLFVVSAILAYIGLRYPQFANEWKEFEKGFPAINKNEG